MRRVSYKKIFVFAAVCLLVVASLNLTACRSESFKRPDASDYARQASYAIAQDEDTALGRALADGVKAHKAQSGFRFLPTGEDSLKYRLALIQAAEKTLDLQYYTIHDDVSANLLLEALIRAAHRGVRVRFLIDHIAMDEVGESLSVLDGVKNLEIRVFNPPATRDQHIVTRIAGCFVDLGKRFKRMHNKAMIADNQLAIVGGRNLGDEYFETNPERHFKDADLLAAGPVTARISHSFDRYWNSDDTFPIVLIRKPQRRSDEIEKLRAELHDNWEKELLTEDGSKLLRSNLGERLKQGQVGLIWAPSEVWADEPEKIEGDADETESKPLSRLEQLSKQAKEEFILISPYFVPQEEGMAWLKTLVARGVKVRVLTNSLASTDVVLVHSGYKRYREDLIKSGIELYEFKPVENKRPKQRLAGTTAPARAVLHTKMYIVDRASVVIGSLNFDPRSESLNTEIALIVHDKTLAAQMGKLFEAAISPQTSYKLVLDKETGLKWVTEEKGQTVFYQNEPEAGIRHLQSWVFGLLPIEDQL